MENSAGRVYIRGLVILSNDGFEIKAGVVEFNYGAIQACNGNYLSEASNGTQGTGYIYSPGGNIEDKNPGNWSTDVKYCGAGYSGLPTRPGESCDLGDTPPGGCMHETFYLTLQPSVAVYDYGDAPSSYGEAKHAIPASPTVCLGSIVPDDESTSQNSTNADGDDVGGSNDEDAFAAMTDLTTADNNYILTVPCSGSATVAGWIDFDKSGTFTNGSPNEQASAACAGGSAALTWDAANSNFPSSLTPVDTAVRLRIASVASEVANPTGIAGDGEAEDYTLAIVCDELPGEVSEVGASIPVQSATGDKVFIASRDLSPAQGHLKAFAVEADGGISTTALWDAAT